MSTCRNICANGSPPGRRPKAIASSRSTSTRRAFCNKKKPAVIGDGRLSLSAQNFLRLYATQRLLNFFVSENGAGWRPRGLHDLGGDVADAGGSQPDRAGRAGGEVEHASLDEGATVID